jgi:hypothetical protein
MRQAAAVQAVTAVTAVTAAKDLPNEDCRRFFILSIPGGLYGLLFGVR